MITAGLRSPGRIAILSFLLGVGASTRAADNWMEVRSPHFTVASNAGEKEARRIADQFELVRATFHSAFPGLRVDPGQSIVILAAKNEGTMKFFLPEQWEDKKHVHTAGIYQQGMEKHYVILRTDEEGRTPYHTLYHEYTHAVLHMNFTHIPLWFDEGMAEYLGNAILSDKGEVRIGVIPSGHVYALQQSKLLPIEVLFSVDHNSPYYNEQNRASVFYAESWAVIHYLVFDPGARRNQLFLRFLRAFQQTRDQVTAARETFGDLKRFGQTIEAYARSTNFVEGVFKPSLETAVKNYSVRAISPGEVLALKGDFFSHHDRADEAKTLVEEALKAEPNLAFAHEAMGFYYYRRNESERAEEEMAEALRLGSQSFVPAYIYGSAVLRDRASLNESRRLEAVKSLEKAVQINPLFAPAYDALAHAYSQSSETQAKAIEMEMKAIRLDPGVITYPFNLTRLLMNANRDEEARALAEKLLASAKSPQEVQMANALLQSIGQRAGPAAGGGEPGAIVLKRSTTAPRVEEKEETTALEERKLRAKEPTWRPIDAEGTISGADCSGKPEVAITLNQEKGPLRLYAEKFRSVSMTFPDNMAVPSPENCSQWKGRKVKVKYLETNGTEFAGEIVLIYFF